VEAHSGRDRKVNRSGHLTHGSWSSVEQDQGRGKIEWEDSGQVPKTKGLWFF
jgi:hypothetical protein